ncbi:MAG TPA: hypothetical protein VF062_22035 [Candidatus Limnocylindrales bacterium]
MWFKGEPAFELTFWCGTCPILFRRLEGAVHTLSIAELESRLAEGLSGTDADIVEAFAVLLPAATYRATLDRRTTMAT